MKLIIAEKPSVAREIAQVVGARGRHQGYIEGGGYLVSWCFGHLVEQASPEQLNPAWQGWQLASLPMLPEQMRWVPREHTGEQLDVLKTLCGRADVRAIINACDAGREGELIFRAVMEYLGVGDDDPRLHRLWTSSLTEQALTQALAQIKPASQWDALADAARARSMADWLVGMNMTRALTCKAREAGYGGGVLSVGRVQTPTLALIVARDLEREAFASKPFFEVLVTLLSPAQATPRPTYEARWINAQGASRLASHAEASQVVERLKRHVTGTITALTRKAERVGAPRLFDLTSLQREANKRYGLTAQQTLDAAQSLYEARLLSYPRTDSRAISEDMVAGFPAMLRALESLSSMAEVPDAARQAHVTLDQHIRRHVKPEEVSDHHAILPTGEVRGLDGLEMATSQVYELVVRRTLAALLADGVDEVAEAITTLGQDNLLTRTRGRAEQGWRTVWEAGQPAPKKTRGGKQEAEDSAQEDAASQALHTAFEQGGQVVRERVVLREGKTTPPAAFTEATLLTAMEHALHGLVDEHELEQGEAAPEGGLGTPATRASTLETLVARRYIERDGKQLISTELGRQVIAALPQGQLTSASWTAKWEQALTRIEQRKLTGGQFMSKAREFTRVVVKQLIDAPPPTMRDMTAVSQCPVCKKGQVKSFEKGWSCTNRADKCSFVIWRELCGKALTEAQVRDLLAGKTTRTLKGFTSKAGKTFDAALMLDKDGRVQLVFDKK